MILQQNYHIIMQNRQNPLLRNEPPARPAHSSHLTDEKLILSLLTFLSSSFARFQLIDQCFMLITDYACFQEQTRRKKTESQPN